MNLYDMACLWINRSISWEDAVYWYEQAVKTHDNDEGGQFDCTINDPSYTLMAKQAEMYRQGGHGLDKDPQRAGTVCERPLYKMERKYLQAEEKV